MRWSHTQLLFFSKLINKAIRIGGLINFDSSNSKYHKRKSYASWSPPPTHAILVYFWRRCYTTQHFWVRVHFFATSKWSMIARIHTGFKRKKDKRKKSGCLKKKYELFGNRWKLTFAVTSFWNSCSSLATVFL